MTASILKQDPDTRKVQKNAIYLDKIYFLILPSTGHEHHIAQK